MHISPKTAESFSRLKTALAYILSDSRPMLRVTEDGECPLLVLETEQDSVGFAIVNGAPPEDAFSAAYQTFKRLYRTRHETWRDRNLSFVLCRTHPEPRHDAFFGAISTDAYFCPKYVLWLRSDPTALEEELRRLPFLPIPNNRPRGAIRGPSAQSLLQAHGLSYELARQIVVPRVSAVHTLAEWAVSPVTSLPAIRDAEGGLDLQAAGPMGRTRIESVAIQSFRAYGERQAFDVDADVVVLYGPNGLGKTSFFDAVDFVCTGRIGRLHRKRMNQQSFTKLAQHLGRSSDPGHVEIKVRVGPSHFCVRRDIDNWGEAKVDGSTRNRTSTLQLLTSATWSKKKPRIENLERLFRATHLFSQSRPELLADFEQTCRLSEELVSRTLAMDDYATGLDKAHDVLTSLERRRTEGEKRQSALVIGIEELEAKLTVSQEIQISHEAGTELQRLAEELREALNAEAKLSVEGSEFSQRTVREWRAVTETALREERERLDRLQRLESGHAGYDRARKRLLVQKRERDELQQEIESTRERLKLHTTGMAALQRQMEAAKSGVADIQRRRSNLARLGDLAKDKSTALLFLQRLQEESAGIAKKLQEATTRVDTLASHRVSLAQKTLEVTQTLAQATERIARLESARAALPRWELARQELKQIEASIAAAQKDIEGAGIASEQANAEVRRQGAQVAQLEDEFNLLTAGQAALTHLLDEMEAHVTDGVCPTCGIDHGDETALRARIRAQKKERPLHIHQKAALLHAAREAHTAAAAHAAALTTKALSAREELERHLARREAVVHSLAALDDDIRHAEITPGINEVDSKVVQLVEQATAWRQAAQESLSQLEQESTNLDASIETAQASQTALERQAQVIRAKSSGVGEQVEEIGNAERELALSLTPPEGEATSPSERFDHQESTLRQEMVDVATQIDQMTGATAADQEKVAQLNARLEEIEAESESLRADLKGYEDLSFGLFHGESFDFRNVSEARALSGERVNLLEGLVRRSITVERSFDAAQHSAQVAELKAALGNLTTAEKRQQEDLDRTDMAIGWFRNVSDILEGERSRAVEGHVGAFGPIATLFQRRLRPVFGFGDIELVARGSEIHVTVDRDGGPVLPIDYFSDSQKQILMLSLFLAARLAQTWSGFAPILMDDPVTHFDDLNAFAFVELMRGIVNNSPGERQFFISTCEHRLFELMRQKLGDTPGGAKFFEIEGIDSEGPRLMPVTP